MHGIGTTGSSLLLDVVYLCGFSLYVWNKFTSIVGRRTEKAVKFIDNMYYLVLQYYLSLKRPNLLYKLWFKEDDLTWKWLVYISARKGSGKLFMLLVRLYKNAETHPNECSNSELWQAVRLLSPVQFAWFMTFREKTLKYDLTWFWFWYGIRKCPTSLPLFVWRFTNMINCTKTLNILPSISYILHFK